jgi:hypothetical protein
MEPMTTDLRTVASLPLLRTVLKPSMREDEEDSLKNRPTKEKQKTRPVRSCG